MKRFRWNLMAGLWTLLPMAVFAAPGSGIVGTDHDFTQGAFQTTTPVGVCTICHTPHHAISTLLLWNHTLSANTFSWDIPKTTAGTEYPTFVGNTYTGPTAKCLSCHDGSVAVGDIAWFSDAGPYPGGTGIQTAKITGSHQIATVTGGMAGNHPVAMPYPFNNAANTYNGKTTGPAANLTEWVADPQPAIRLFNDATIGGVVIAGSVAGKTGIECSSCHEPHNGKAAVDDMFLRGRLTGSTTDYLCLECHKK